MRDPTHGAEPERLEELLRAYLRGVSFPAEGNSLLSAMLSNGAPSDLVRTIHAANRSRFGGLEEVVAVIRDG